MNVTRRRSTRRASPRSARRTPRSHAAVADQTVAYHRFRERGERTYLHDPLTAVEMLRPDLLRWHDYAVAIELEGLVTRGMTVASRSDQPKPAVAININVEACRAFILERIVAETRTGP